MKIFLTKKLDEKFSYALISFKFRSAYVSENSKKKKILLKNIVKSFFTKKNVFPDFKDIFFAYILDDFNLFFC